MESNRKNTLTALIISIACSLALTGNELSDDNSSRLLDKKQVPADEFYLQRSWPDIKPDVRAYEQALQSVAASSSSRAQIIPGFSASWRLEGPKNIGGRINTILVHPTNQDIIYVGNASGGIFKTVDGGTTWESIFDDQPYLPIGHLAFEPGNPSVIYAATGDPNITGLPFIGDGIWKSMDSGQTWTHLGLTDQRIISKVVINPQNPQEIYAAAMGLPFERNLDRGLYKSVDGGLTWTLKLFLSDEAGIIDLVMDPNNPQTIYAVGWDRIRNNQESLISGPNSKIFKSTDGGGTWAFMGNGLPTGTMSRIGITISESNPDVLYAVFVDSNLSFAGIYKTIDGGTNWSLLPGNGIDPGFMGGFGWYFGRIVVNPSDEDHVYVCGITMYYTLDGGINWTEADPAFDTHADKHDVWFLSAGSQIVATDGGLYRTNNGGVNWFDIDDIPNNQFYRITHDPHNPGVITGGLQDNGTVTGDHTGVNSWNKIFGADGFQPVYDPIDPNNIFVEIQYGGIYASDNGGAFFSDATNGIDNNDRRNWDMPYTMSPHDPTVLYCGTYRIYKNSNGVNALWSPVSSDLTDGVVFSPRFHTITTIAESPVVQGLVYVGTSDGNVWYTPNDGITWNDITAGLPDRYVTSVRPSPDPQNPSTVYVTVSGYKYNEQIPHVFRSDDNGNTWTDISGDLPQVAPNDLIVMPGYSGQVLMLATDGGVYGTLTGGIHWERLGNNLPVLPVYDIDLIPGPGLLVASTYGRSAWTYPVDSLVLSVGTFEIDAQEKISLWPNPASDVLYFQIPSGFERSKMTVTDLGGRVVRSLTLDGQIRSGLRLEDLSPGVYILSFRSADSVIAEEFVRY